MLATTYRRRAEDLGRPDFEQLASVADGDTSRDLCMRTAAGCKMAKTGGEAKPIAC
jgi:hypothetical protein